MFEHCWTVENVTQQRKFSRGMVGILYPWPTNAFILEYLYNLIKAKHTRPKEDIGFLA